jgi:hypothetical protein
MKRGPGIALALLLLAVGAGACAHEPPAAAVRAPSQAKAGSCHHAMPACAGSPPTYADDLRPILEKHCFKCHAGDGVEADDHNFSHVETLRAQKRALANEIGQCAMPPSPEPAVSDSEAELLLRWVACGAADGPRT